LIWVLVRRQSRRTSTQINTSQLLNNKSWNHGDICAGVKKQRDICD